MFELVTGKPLFSADSSDEILYKHVNNKPENISNITLEVPKDLKLIISKCLEKDPDNRFQTAIEIRKRIALFKNNTKVNDFNSFELGRKEII